MKNNETLKNSAMASLRIIWVGIFPWSIHPFILPIQSRFPFERVLDQLDLRSQCSNFNSQINFGIYKASLKPGDRDDAKPQTCLRRIHIILAGILLTTVFHVGKR